ncbi:hypothetical protein [Nocardia yunnanensis]|uniref:hypothetical protein n=1 Tax=Nocardia yunnanensis TaxID=2382165 RepID=UPI0013C4AE35|nr:hypothetical protein [Nocardia yunnanensis]
MSDWTPAKWFRVREPDGSLWIETSDEDEARQAATETGWPLERHWRKVEEEWRTGEE